MAEYLSDEEVNKVGFAPAAQDSYLSDEEINKVGFKTAPVAETPALQPSEAQDLEQISPVESFARSGLQIPSMGFADEFAGATQAGMQALTGGASSLSDLEKLYTAYRDIERRKDKAAAEANPKSSMAGTLAGGIVTAAIPGLNITTIPGAAALGAASGLGSSEADLTKGELGKAAIDTGTGAALGAATQKVLPVIGQGVSGLRQSLESRGKKSVESGAKKLFGSLNPTNAEMGDFRAALGSTAADVGEDVAKAAANEFDDISLPQMVDKYVSVKGGPAEAERLIQQRIKELEATKAPLFQQAVDKLGNLESGQIAELNKNSLAPKLNQLADQIALSQKNLSPEKAVALSREIKDMFGRYQTPMTKLPSLDPKTGEAMMETAEVAARDPGNLLDLNKMKQEFGEALGSRGFNQAEQIAEGLMSPENKAMLQAKREAYDVLRDHMTQVGDIIGGDLGTAIKRANLEESNLIKLRQIANKAANQEAKSGGGGVATGIFGSAGGAAGAALAGPVGGALGFGAGLATKGALEDYLGQNVGAAAKVAAGKMKQAVGNKMLGMAESLENVEPALQKFGQFVEKQADSGTVSGIAQRSPFREQKDTSNLATYDNDQLGGVSKVLQGSGDSKLKTYGEALQKALNTGDPQAKNAAIFLIMQNPKARQQLGLMNKGQ
jgi:hypothetical protein